MADDVIFSRAPPELKKYAPRHFLVGGESFGVTIICFRLIIFVGLLTDG